MGETLIVVLLLQLLQSVIGMVDECKSAVKSLRQQCQLTTLRSVDLQADINHRAGPSGSPTTYCFA